MNVHTSGPRRYLRPMILGPALALLIASMLAPATLTAQEATGQETAHVVPQPVPRRENAARPDRARPQAPPLPADLGLGTAPQRSQAPVEAPAAVSKPVRGAASAPLVVAPRTGVRRATPGPAPGQSADDLARRGAAWAAKRLIERSGRTEVFRVGFHQGLHQALEDPSLGMYDLREGRRIGSRDPAARTSGLELGHAAAEDLAAREAAATAAAEFRQLEHQPRRRPSAVAPTFNPEGGWAEAPALRDMFSWADRSQARLLADLDRSHNPWDLWQANDIGSVYDQHWTDPKRAFDLWLGDRRNASLYRSIQGDASRARFKQLFADELGRQLTAAADRVLRHAHTAGFNAGWDYGAAVATEWSFRKGYTEGFNQAVAGAAGFAFDQEYAEAFQRAYHDTYLDWLESPHPEVLDVTLDDANDDGIFEPGETLRARYRLANYGGAPGEVVVQLEGAALEQPMTAMVAMPARSEIVPEAPLKAVVSHRSHPGLTTELRLAAGTGSLALPLLVSYPLVLDSPSELVERDNLRGRARLAVRIANSSLRPVDAALRLERPTAEPTGATGAPGKIVEVGRLEPGASRQVELVAEDLETLEMLRGGTELRVVAVGPSAVGRRGDTVVHDSASYRLSCAATDLSNRDVLLHMVRIARTRAATAAERSGLHQLMLRRLEVDWQAVADASGNLYKEDAKDHGRRTALGDLVRTYHEERDRMTHPEIFNGLGARILALEQDLPGVHPFLRKHFKRLARQLD